MRAHRTLHCMYVVVAAVVMLAVLYYSSSGGGGVLLGIYGWQHSLRLLYWSLGVAHSH